MLDAEKSFEEIAEIYSGFPLKKDFLETGNAALAPHGVQALLENGVIRIPFADRPLYDEKELDDLAEEEEIKQIMLAGKLRIAACISLGENSRDGILDAFYESEIIFPDGPGSPEEETDIRGEEYDKAISLIETFLNAAVDAG